jgi:predicted transcriptional regulator of viral defense system
LGSDSDLRVGPLDGVPVRSTEAFADLIQFGQPIMRTREVAVRLGVSASRASQVLRSMDEAGLVRRLRHGLWAIRRDVNPFVVPAYLTAPLPAYVSFWSALARHGMIEQVPRQVSVASLDGTRRVVTSIANYSIHQISPELFGGYEGTAETGYVATPEKALFDTVYLRAPRGLQVLLPELELPEGFSKPRLEEWNRRIAQPRLRTVVSRSIARALADAARP